MVTIRFLHWATFCLLVIGPFSCSSKKSSASPDNCAYTILDKARTDRIVTLSRFTENISKNADKIEHDPLMLQFFGTKYQYYKASLDSVVTPEQEAAMTSLKELVKQHYLNNYLNFYDILCIDTAGTIFYTIRKQKDYRKNIFSEEFAETSLSKKLRGGKTQSFIDYELYRISNEPSAFFVKPAVHNGVHLGWFAMQFSISRINSIFKPDSSLGSTGEVILVNRDHFMLTDSRFDSRSSILKKQLSPENIEMKVREKKGHAQVIDYRGFNVFSSFEVFSMLGSEWLIISKINAAEINNHCLTQDKKLRSTDFSALVWPRGEEAKADFRVLPDTYSEVDMDDFKRADSQETLFTHGLSTCTGFLVSYPGRFAYLAHISPFDCAYGNTDTDLAGNILEKIETYEIFPHEKPYLTFTIVAPHTKSVAALIQAILDKGYFYSQIHAAINTNMRYANLMHHTQSGMTTVIWRKPGDPDIRTFESTNSIQSVEELLMNQ